MDQFHENPTGARKVHSLIDKVYRVLSAKLRKRVAVTASAGTAGSISAFVRLGETS